jgi:hypothetical protein
MNFLKNNRVANNEVSQYATSEDFCRVFMEDMADLHQLSLILTADHDQAEKCFVAGVEDCVKTNRVFREQAHSWAKRTIVQEAIRTLRPHPDHAGSSVLSTVFPKSVPTTFHGEHVELNRVLSLEEFERFVFVMSVLENYSEHDCALLLGCSLRDIEAARVRALQQLARLDREFSARDSVTDLLAV